MHNIISTDIDYQDVIPSTLEGVAVHPLFRRDTFRMVSSFDRFCIETLDQAEYDLSEIVFERMKPALRLASLFLQKSLPTLLSIAEAPLIDCEEPWYRNKQLDLIYDWTPRRLARFNRVFLRMCETYRITFAGDLNADQRNSTRPNAETIALSQKEGDAITIYAQTALSTEWLWFLIRADWDSMAEEEKFGKMLVLAVTLVHELAHALWIERMASTDGNMAEPAFYPHLKWKPDLGFEAIEISLFNGVFGIPNLGNQTTIERSLEHGEGSSYRVSFSTIDYEGYVTGTYHVSKHSIFRFFAITGNMLGDTIVQDSPSGYCSTPEIIFDLLDQETLVSRRISTELAEPERPLLFFSVVKIPDPRDLKPAITAINELVPRDKEGKFPGPTAEKQIS